MPLTLYHFDACPHCEKVRLALALERLPYESVEIDPADRTEVLRVSGQPSVPVLVEEDGAAIPDSLAILRHLAQRPGSELLPKPRRDQALTWVLVDRANGVLGPLTSRLTSRADPHGNDLREDELRSLERKLDAELAILEGMLERGPFLFGDRPTLADIVAHAFLNRLHRIGGRAIPESFVRVAAWYHRVETAARAQEK